MKILFRQLDWEKHIARPQVNPPVVLGPLFGRVNHQSEVSHSDAFVRVAHHRAEKPAAQKMHAPIPWFDYRLQGFSPAFAREFAEKPIGASDTGPSLIGKDLLQRLVTDVAILPSSLPAPDRMDFARFGVSEISLRDWAEKKDLPVYELHDALQEAFRLGLIYRMTDLNHKIGYVGVPYSVRSQLALESPVAKAPIKELNQKDVSIINPEQAILMRLCEAALNLPAADKPELLEYTAQLVKAAITEGRLQPENLPKKYVEEVQKFDFITPSFDDALLTLADALSVFPHLRQHPFFREGTSLIQMHPRPLNLVQMV
ncbi:MAG: hypothetical protein K2X01_01705 [Cyanobacteria bacterium]|nr:hypothetical protein [Cyanobacteriota bacterium]